jgi:hypothetical protein
MACVIMKIILILMSSVRMDRVMQRDWQAMGREFLMERAARGDQRAAEIIGELLLQQPEQPGDARTVGPAARAVIGVCTAMRPRMLAHCLDAIAAQIVPPGVEIHIAVVDNEGAPNNPCADFPPALSLAPTSRCTTVRRSSRWR